MRSKHLVDTELLPLLDLLPKIMLTDETLLDARAALLPPVEETGAESATVVKSSRSVPGPAGAPDVGVAIYAPAQHRGELPCIFHIHGGGYVLGTVEMMDSTNRRIVAETHCVIVSVDYRLAPETPFPGAIEDCYAALSWVHAQADRLGVDRQRIGVMGESAGGGFAAALALLCRDRGEFSLLFQHLIYPMIDDRTCVTVDPNPCAGEFVWTPTNNYFGWSSLVGVAPGSTEVSQYAAAARAADLAGLPSTFIMVGALDLFLDENIEYARRLARAGVCVELHVYPGAFHGFDMAVDTRVGAQANRDRLAALMRAFGAHSN